MRITANISEACAAVSDTVTDRYINNLKVTLEGILSDRIYNYDETNLTANVL